MASFEPHTSTPDGGPEDSLDLALRTGLRTLSDQARYTGPPAPAAQIRSRGTRRHQRRMIGTAAVATVAVAAAVTVSIGRLPGVPHPNPAPVASSATDLPTPTGKDPAPDPANDVGYLLNVQSAGGRLTLMFDRATVLKDGRILNLNPQLRTFTVSDEAALGGGQSPQRLNDLAFASVQSTHHGLLVSLAHQGTAEGMVMSVRQLPDPAQS